MSIFGSRTSGYFSGASLGASGVTTYYGSYIDTSTQLPIAANTAYPISINTLVAQSGISITNDTLGNPTKVVFANVGIYNITISVQFTNSDNNIIHDAALWLRKNAENSTGNIADSNSRISIHGKHNAVNGEAILTVNYVISLAANDYLQFVYSVSDTTVFLETIAGTATVPRTPSVILTAFKIA